ncbi:SAM-dependent methyltransferase [Natronoglycomyces albus]|uniref:SAM-dependent methyltransferase n=1 Tax=Natronoglycomyces albus TaxID=2811108 RepID=A0A895XU12_9ACTN|nr:SAM-dependent methyltransferase [Natronoglycomyces albus]QSB05138.1 SAM-dependent methyltransferase [Natronoglycomyces albus]
MSTFARWATVMSESLYGEEGFYRQSDPIEHFRTSAHYWAFAQAVARIIDRLTPRLDEVTVVDVGAGRGELLNRLASLVTADIRLIAVEVRPRPGDLPQRVEWRTETPSRFSGLLLACELLDNIPLDVAVQTPQGWRYEEVDRTGATRPGPKLSHTDRAWIEKWWPEPHPADADERTEPNFRAEIGRPRDQLWRDITGRLTHGAAIAIDYGHTRGMRPQHRTITGYRHGRQVPPQLDGSTDITAHVSFDSLSCHPSAMLLPQREALLRCGITGQRPPITQAHIDPFGYATALGQASEEAELINNDGLGAHWWLVEGIDVPAEELLPVHEEN